MVFPDDSGESRFEMPDHTPIVADKLRVHGTLHPPEREALIDHWQKLDHRLQSFEDRGVALDLYIHDRDHTGQRVTLEATIPGFAPFIATHEARATDEYKQEIVKSGAADIVASSLFTGIHGNYLKGPIARAGMDPDNLPESDPRRMNFDGAKAWKDIWGSGQGIGAIKEVVPTADLVDRLANEYAQARAALCG